MYTCNPEGPVHVLLICNTSKWTMWESYKPKPYITLIDNSVTSRIRWINTMCVTYSHIAKLIYQNLCNYHIYNKPVLHNMIERGKHSKCESKLPILKASVRMIWKRSILTNGGICILSTSIAPKITCCWN